MTYSAIKNKKTELIRKARDGSVFIAPITATAITALTTGSATNELQTVTITGTPTGGTFTLTYASQTTAAIAYNATAGAVQTALENLTNIDPGDVTVGGGPGPGTAYTVTFTGRLAATDVAVMTATGSFAGGSSPAVAVTTTTPGTGIDLAALPSGYEDLGWTSTDGITYGRDTQISEVHSFGSVDPTRADVTSDRITMQVTCQETRALTIGLYTGQDMANVLSTAGTGEVSIAKPDVPGFRYYRVLGLFVDRDDLGREIYLARFMPRSRITSYSEQKYSDGDAPIEANLTFTGFNDSSLGYSHKWFWGGAGWKPLLTSMGIS